MANWMGLVPPLVERGYRVVALDLRGHGWSGRPDADYSIEAQARIVLGLVDQLGVDDFTVVGHSWGSAVSLQVTLLAQERVERVVLFNGMFFKNQQPVVFHWARVPGLGEVIYGVFYPERQDEKMAFAFYDAESIIDEPMVEAVESMMKRPGTLAAALASVRAMRFDEMEPHYSDITQPTLLLWGREDQVTPLRHGERIYQTLGNARLVVLPQCGHLPMIEAPNTSLKELIRFLDESAS
jgi:pimeloyl-ACP methyl ester carboxylesterase